MSAKRKKRGVEEALAALAVDVLDDSVADDLEDGGIADDPETGGKILTLLHPIKVGEREITQLALKRPKMKHMREMDKAKGGDLEKLARMMVLLSGEAIGVIDALDAEDMVRAVKVIEGFTGALLETGET